MKAWGIWKKEALRWSEAIKLLYQNAKFFLAFKENIVF